ncbi:hypothetical protein VE04_09901, partial [Pseudogymnoascus sp. 24MN13]
MGAFTNAAGRLTGRSKNEKEDEATEPPPTTNIFGPDSTAIAPETLRAQDAAERDERVPLARQATAVEKEMSTWTCVRAFWPAVLQAIILSCACIMEGFDLVLITGFLTNPVFRRRYQCPDASLDGKVCEIPASWQSAIVIGPTVGQMAGVLLSGWLVERFGYKRTFMAPWAYVTAWSNVCWIIGQCLGAVTQRALVNNMTMLSIQIPLGLQWVFPLPIFIFSLWAQESPWWLVRKGRNDEARKVLTKLVSQSRAPEGYSIDGQLAMIQLTNADELRETNGTGTGYLDCFRGVNRRRTEISTFTWVIQNASGSALMQWSPYFFQRAGMASEQTWNFVIVQYALGLVGTAISWCLRGRVGRRTIELWGLFLLTFVLTICGIIAIIGLSAELTGWISGSLLLLYTLVYGCTIGLVTDDLVAELSSTRTKSKTINIARMGYNAFGVFNCVVTPYQLNPTALNWGMKTAWFWVVFCALCFVYAFFRIPEPRGRTYAEMDWLFAEGISARKFASTVVPRFGDEMEGEEGASSSVESYEKKGGG